MTHINSKRYVMSRQRSATDSPAGCVCDSTPDLFRCPRQRMYGNPSVPSAVSPFVPRFPASLQNYSCRLRPLSDYKYSLLYIFLKRCQEKPSKTGALFFLQPVFYRPFFVSNLYPMPHTVEIAQALLSGSFSLRRLICTYTVRVSPRYSYPQI